MSDSGDFFAVARPATAHVPAVPDADPQSQKRRLRTVVLTVGCVVALVGAVTGVLVTRGNAGPHASGADLQATTALRVTFPASLDGYPRDPTVTLNLAGQAAQLNVPAVALSTEAFYRGATGTIVVAGGPLPRWLRYSGSAQQAGLIEQIRTEYGGGTDNPPQDWGPRSTGALGGQLWCGTPAARIPGGRPLGMCWMVDSQNVLNITVIGPNALTTAEAVRPQVEVASR